MYLIKKEIKSFGYAIEGISYAFKTQINFKLQITIALLSILLGLFVNLARLEWLVLMLTISSVLSAELLNTVIERLVDFKTSKFHSEAKIVKDLSAGVVLLVSAIALVIGLILFTPHLIIF